ncbi:MAG: YgfZ/GcvT domain-containing protein [Candidatus Methylumidiphilus sp.]
MHSWHTPLPDIGVLSLSGQDAAKFLQGQATCDILGLPPGQTTLGALCTVKGRVAAVFRALRLDDRIFLLLPLELLDAVRQRLGKYVLRADVKIADVSGEWAAFGLYGEHAPAALETLGLPPLEQENEAEGQSGFYASFYAIRIADLGHPRFLVLVDAAKAAGMGRFLDSHNLPQADAAHWALEDIRAGIPSVKAATVEEFLPQMLNLDRLGGISFNKGCYTGQEIVARTHYLGQVKRRMQRLAGMGEAVPVAGEALGRVGEDGQPVGVVVDAAVNPDGGFEALAVLTAAALDAPLQTADGRALHLSTLPYALDDSHA